MIKVIAIDFGGVYFTWKAKELNKNLSKATGAKIKDIEYAYLKKIRDLHVKRISEKDFWDYFCKITGTNLNHKVMKDIVEAHPKPILQVVNMMKELRKNYKLCLLTNNTVNLDRIDKRYRIYKNFDVVMSSHMVKMQKPYNNIYKLLIKKSRCKPQEIVFIDDKERNLKPARRLGIKTIRFKDATKLKKDLKKFGVKV